MASREEVEFSKSLGLKVWGLLISAGIQADRIDTQIYMSCMLCVNRRLGLRGFRSEVRFVNTTPSAWLRLWEGGGGLRAGDLALPGNKGR